MKKILSYILILCVILAAPSYAFASNTNTLDDVISDTAQYIYTTVKTPTVGSVGGEWAVFSLARSGAEIPNEYYRDYYDRAEKYIVSNGGVLSDKKYTEYSRVIIALTAIGKNPSNAGGYNLLLPLGDFEKTVSQGINGAVWALLALDSGDYEIPINSEAATQATREMYIEYILNNALQDGGWALQGDEAEADITAMVITALAPYRDREAVKEAVSQAVEKLSAMQQQDGGYGSCESAAQVITAISALNISTDDSRFIKKGNTLFDNLMTYRTSENGFAHETGGGTNQMATEQALYALDALWRRENGKNGVFDIKDALVLPDKEDNKDSFGLANKNADISYKEVIYPNKTFADISDSKYKTAIEALTERDIISGMTDTTFEPSLTMTRAEFATITVRGLGLQTKSDNTFNDVSADAWYYDYICTAYYYGIVSGVTDTEFNPNGTITREEAASMVTRAASLCRIDTYESSDNIRNVLSAFTDYKTVSDWASGSMAFCYENGILDDSEIEIKPKEAITREEIADMLFNMMRKAELL